MMRRFVTAAVAALAVWALTGAEAWQDGSASFEDVADVRVAPLVKSIWGQTSDTGYSNVGDPCFNSMTPSGAPCGCSAVAMAQIMRYWGAAGISTAPAGSFACAFANVPTSYVIEAGTYDWDNMPLDTTAGIPLNQRLAIGKLTYDCAVALHSNFGTKGTGAVGSYAFSIFTETFGYASAVGYCPSEGVSPAAVRESVFASLDAGSPVMASLVAGETNHEVLLDGYAFLDGVAYVHVNFGWNVNQGAHNGWFNFNASITAKGNDFDTIDAVVYNIFPKTAGDVLSGRVLDENGKPQVGTTVTAINGKRSWTSVTDERGIYAFLLEGGKSYALAAGGAKMTVTLRQCVSADCSWTNPLHPYHTRTGTCGNSWGNDLVLRSDAPDPEPDPEPEPTEDLGPFYPKKALNGVYPYVGAVYDGSGKPRGIMTLKIGKPSKSGISKVSGTVVMVDGKKYTVNTTSVPVNAAASVKVEGIEIKKLGVMSLWLGEKGFAAEIVGSDGVNRTAATSDMSRGLPAGAVTFRAEGDGLPQEIDGHSVLSAASPDGQSLTVLANGKWDCGKAATLKLKKDPETGAQYVDGLSDPKKPNRSSLKLSYTAKAATFKGSFYLYCNDSKKLRKYTFKVNGVVVDGVGVGVAVCSRPNYSCEISIK